jgi:hypothetical protein
LGEQPHALTCSGHEDTARTCSGPVPVPVTSSFQSILASIVRQTLCPLEDEEEGDGREEEEEDKEEEEEEGTAKEEKEEDREEQAKKVGNVRSMMESGEVRSMI